VIPSSVAEPGAVTVAQKQCPVGGIAAGGLPRAEHLLNHNMLKLAMTLNYVGAVTGTTCRPETTAETSSNTWGFPKNNPSNCPSLPPTTQEGREQSPPPGVLTTSPVIPGR